ncbi:hypothetical protein [Salmonella enterica]|uniref:hypothetical protein n=1 Tax=Salmonella enterica TaxID=28901 RepID=UPI000DEC215F|nr:hypothetical protein [Salmonella enterica]AXD44197.1 hypothetical protein CHD70_18950 [Salmonella enterica]
MSKDTWPVSASSYRINWAPQTVVEEVLQNVSTILATQPGTVPYSRKLGVTSGLVDSQAPVLLLWPREIIQKVSEFEPRAIIHSVSFDKANASDGVIRPKLVIGVKR